MEYEVNQVLITPLGGELDKPIFMYQAHLSVIIAFFALIR
jgi:serum/glucocorticoid-regulated kinase 2